MAELGCSYLTGVELNTNAPFDPNTSYYWTPDRLKAIGWTGGDITVQPNSSLPSYIDQRNMPGNKIGQFTPQFQAYLDKNGYKITNEALPNGNGRYDAVLDSKGNPVAGTERTIAPSEMGNLGKITMAAIIAAGAAGAATGGFGAAAGEGAGAAGAGASGGGGAALGGGEAVGGSGLTAGGAASGAGLTASPGAGLTLAAPTGTGAGLSAGTGSGVIGSGIGASIPAGSMLSGTGAGGAASTGGLGSLTGSKLGDQVVNNLGGKVVNGAIGSVIGGLTGNTGNGPISGGQTPAASVPAGELAKSIRSYMAFNPDEITAPAAREGHTRGPSSAVNMGDPSAALFGYGTQHKYYDTVDSTKEKTQPVAQGPQSLAEGGSVMEDDGWGDILNLLTSGVGGSGIGGNPESGTGDYSWLNTLGDNTANAATPTSSSGVDYSLFGSSAAPGAAQTLPADFASKYAAQPDDSLLGKAKGAWNGATSWLDRLSSGDKRANSQMQLGLGALGLLNSYMNRNKAQPNAAQMRSQLKSPYSSWTPQQQADFNKYFYQQVPNYVSPIKRADGGGVPGNCMGGLAHLARGGSLVSGAGGGQDDRVPAKLSPGEYVMDADTVASLGDGDNAAGAAKLDAMRHSIRTHKRAAPADSIPPKAHSPLHYLKK